MKNARRLTLLIALLLIITTAFTSCELFSTKDNTEGSSPVSLDAIPVYSGSPYVAVNGNEPFFTAEEITTEAFESYSPLDSLGRCGVAFASLARELMPTEERGDINSVTPSGWEYGGRSNNKRYSGEWLYNRCHLIGHQLAGENANEKNLITGTRYLNIEGMLPFENQIADYIKETGNHVMYRVTPIYEGDNLVASGVLMEGYSVEDEGEGIFFCIYAYNVQPGVEINYKNGQSRESGDTETDISGDSADTPTDPNAPTYILNKSSKKYHLPGTSCAGSVSEANRLEYYESVEAFPELYPDYTPCGTCKP